jgi:hypothetical protein
MIAGKIMAGGIPRATYLTKYLIHLSRQDAAIQQASQQLKLRFFRRNVKAGSGCEELCQGFCKLTYLEQAGIRVIGEVFFGEHAQTKQLLVVLAQHRKI